MTKKQDAFCRFYCASRNGTEAAINAGYGKNKDYAASIACRLLKKTEIIQRIHDIDAEMWTAVGVTPEMIGVRAERAYQAAAKEGNIKFQIKALEFMRAGLPKSSAVGTVDVNIRLIGGDES